MPWKCGQAAAPVACVARGIGSWRFRSGPRFCWFAALVVALTLSPLWEVVARLALLVSFVALISCLLRRSPASTWGIAVVVAAVSMYAFGGVSNALYSETSEQTKPTGTASSDLANADRPKRETEEASREVGSTDEEAKQTDAEGARASRSPISLLPCGTGHSRTAVSTSLPVRVVRGAGHDSPYSPGTGYSYDGLYSVDDHWYETGRSGFRV
jgi:hypothetical protein